ncbi:MAG TPA: AMP-binding protein [Bryobacteraceae bacterium]|nr:AMP-binding protein [Bryobacteraceae bacterium]
MKSTPRVIGNPPSLSAFFSLWSRSSAEFLHYEGDIGPVRLTYSAASAAASGFAARLRASGIARGERILFWCENRPEWIVALWGCLLEGVIAVPIDFRSSATVVQRIAQIVSARALLISEGLIPPNALPCPVWPMREVLDNTAATAAFNPAPEDETAEILFTSGATGEPKGVTITHRNILANLKPIDQGIEQYRRYMGPFKPIRFLNLLPLSHMFGQSMAAFIPAMIEGEVFFMSGSSPREAAQLIHRRRISVLVCVPQMLELLRDYILQAVPSAAEPPRSGKWYARWWQYRRVHRLLGWKFWSFVVGAAPLDPALEEFWRKLGYVVIQGYGLTETAPVATLNHPFETRKGSVGKPIAGVEIRIAPDGEILLRGENITPGYFGQPAASLRDNEGFLHTGDVGALDNEGRLTILGRKKEMIVSPDGLNVYPEDVERVLNAISGVRESAVVAKKEGARELVHAALVLAPGTSAESVIGEANSKLETHQRVRGWSIWPGDALPRTSGTGKLKRGEVAVWVAGSGQAPPASSGEDSIEDVISKFAGGRKIDANTSLDDLGLSSLDRIQLLMELEKRTGAPIDETSFANARSVADLVHAKPAVSTSAETPFEYPEWNLSAWGRAVRRVMLPGLIIPLTRAFAWLKVEGLENLRDLKGPVIFASNHQSHFDAPAILAALPARWRYRLSPAAAKEFFETRSRIGNFLNYYLATLVFNIFPLPQREAGAREAMRHAGVLVADGYSILIFPEGRRTETGEIGHFQPGVGMLAARLRIPVVPVRLTGLDRVLHKDAKFATPGKASVRFGAPIRPESDDPAAIAKQIELAVRLTAGQR